MESLELALAWYYNGAGRNKRPLLFVGQGNHARVEVSKT
jgi:hypothetical protein